MSTSVSAGHVDAGVAGGRRGAAILVVVLATLMLLWPVPLNRSAIYYSDSFSYLTAGRAAWRTAGKLVGIAPAATPGAAGTAAAPEKVGTPISGRSPFYGIFAWGARAIAGMQFIAVAQAIWVAIVLAMMLPHLGITGWRRQLAAIAALALGSSVAVFADVVLPDIFLSVGVAAVLMLASFGGAMRWPERLFWAGNIAFAGLSHNATLATMAAGLIVIALPLWRQVRGTAWLIVAALALAAVGAAVVPVLNQRLRGSVVTPTPFLLARVIGDGTGARVLQEDCPKAGYASCRFVPYLPMSEEEFLWNLRLTLPWGALPAEDRLAIAGESNRIILAALSRYPVEQVTATASNTVAQFFIHDLSKFSAYLDRQAVKWLADREPFKADFVVYEKSGVSRMTFPLHGLSILWLGVHLVALAVILRTLIRRRDSLPPGLVTFAIAMLIVLVINAGVHGGLSATVGRYQSPLEWLTLLTAIALVVATRRAPRHG